MNLGFGYGRGVPDDVHTAWGARLIVTQDGTTDLLPDRQDLVARDDTAKDALVAALNDGGIRDIRIWIEGLLRSYTMKTREEEEFRAEFGGLRVVANTNASAGYCYIAVWLDEHKEEAA